MQQGNFSVQSLIRKY